MSRRLRDGAEGCRSSTAACASFLRMLVRRALTRQPAFGFYLRAPSGNPLGTGLLVLTLTGDRICAITRFDDSVLPRFGLPRSRPGR